MLDKRLTVPQVLDNTAAEHGDLAAMREKVDGEWQTITWDEYRDQARNVARAFMSLGLQPGRAFSTQTANGQSVSYAVNLERVGVGGITLQQVPASITPGLMTREVLLGMSFLKHIEFTQRGDQLILRQLP